MTRFGDTCVLCERPILDVNEIVRPDAYPWRLEEAGLAHRDCANEAAAERDSIAASDEGDWQAIQEEVWE